jgi:hypothetical protein
MHKTGRCVRPHPNSATARPHGPVLETRVPSRTRQPNDGSVTGKSSQSMTRSFGKQRHRARPWIALAAAYMLVLEVILSGLMAGAAAGSVWSAVPSICSFGGATTVPDGSGQQSDHAHLPPCCVLGCDMFSPSTAPPVGVASLPAPRPSVRAAIRPFARDRIALRREQTLHSPRGPPRVTAEPASGRSWSVGL